jgi:hypothetical protein
MFFVPLNQIESVELVIHALRAAAGQADCSVCPVRKVCTQQCLTIADAIETMASSGMLPDIDPDPDDSPPKPPKNGPSGKDSGAFLKVVK